MNIPFNNKKPDSKNAVFIAQSASLIGEVVLHKNSSVWFNAVLRADICRIEVGEGSNIQDNVVCHVDFDKPVIIGKNVSVGHNATLHGCTIDDGALIGMGSVILDGAQIGAGAIIAAGSVVPPFAKIPAGSLAMGVPAVVKRQLGQDEINAIKENGSLYIELAGKYGQEQ